MEAHLVKISKHFFQIRTKSFKVKCFLQFFVPLQFEEYAAEAASVGSFKMNLCGCNQTQE